MKVVVIGGGIAGLTAAWRLARAGAQVTLLEASERLGGKIRTEREGEFLFEAGPDSFLATKPHALELCAELGLSADIVRPLPGRAFVWARNALHPIPEGVRPLPAKLAPLLASRLFTPIEKARIALDLVLPRGARAAAPGADESVGAIVARRMGGAMVDRLAGPLLAGIHAADPYRLSAAATFPPLLEAGRRGSLLRGLRTARASEGAPFATLAGGLESLVAALARRLEGSEVRTGAHVVSLDRWGGGWRIEWEGGGREGADAVVLAVPSYVAAHLLAEAAPRAAAGLGGQEWLSTAVVTLGYREGEVPPLAGHGFVVARDQPSAITGSTWVSSKWAGRAPAGHVLVRGYLGRAGRPVDLGRGDEELAGDVRADLGRAMGLRAEPVLVHVARWPRSMPQLAVGHGERLTLAEGDLAGLPPIALAGAGYHGTGIADCVREGLAAARRVTQGIVQPGGVASS